MQHKWLAYMAYVHGCHSCQSGDMHSQPSWASSVASLHLMVLLGRPEPTMTPEVKGEDLAAYIIHLPMRLPIDNVHDMLPPMPALTTNPTSHAVVTGEMETTTSHTIYRIGTTLSYNSK